MTAVDPEAPPVDEGAIAEAAARVRRGEIVAFPTESTYGLAALAGDRRALATLWDLKGRPSASPLALVLPDRGAARSLARVFPDRAAELASHWPAPLTLVLPARADLPAELVGPGGGVGMRMSPHPWAAALARRVGAPVTATSANRSGEPPAESAERARRYFGEAIGLYLDAGPSPGAPPSTVVAIDERGELTLIRHGAFDLAAAGFDL